MISRRILLSTLPLLLAGCATSTLPAGTEKFAGNFFLKTHNGKRPDSVQGGYELTTTADTMSLDIINPMGGVAARLTVDPNGAVLERGGQETKAESMQELSQQLFGLDLPLEQLPAWLKGEPVSGIAYERIDADSFTQAGWKIEVRRRHANGDAEFVKIDCLRKSLPSITLLMIVKPR